MSIITLEFDNTLKKSDIIMPVRSSSVNESGDEYQDTNLSDKSQTAVFGIQTPLIMINNTVIDFDAVNYFSLKSTGVLPELVMSVEDRFNLITSIDKVNRDNEVRIQILPKFENAYKKINLTFYIANIQINGTNIRITGTYKLPALTSSQFKSYGEIDTYSFFKTVAQETNLGFATNIAQLNDTRYIYCNHKSLLDTMNSEIAFANTTEHIIDWWVDLWDNINIVDIRERFNAVDNDDDIKIWVAGQVNEISKDNEIPATEVEATITDLPTNNTSELFVKSFNIVNRTGMQISAGTDKVYSVYEECNKEYSDYFMQDSDTMNDIFLKYEYVGECYSEYNYLISRPTRDAFLQKMNIETVVVKLQSPLLGLMRGHRVNFIHYINDDMTHDRLNNMQDIEVIDTNSIESNIPLDKYNISEDSGAGMFMVDKMMSAQYLILGVDVIYQNNTWEYTLTLTKPTNSNNKLVNKDDNTNE